MRSDEMSNIPTAPGMVIAITILIARLVSAQNRSGAVAASADI